MAAKPHRIHNALRIARVPSKFSERFWRGARIPLMKTSELLSKLNRFTPRVSGSLRRLAELFFGNLSWRPRGWLSRTADGCGRFDRAHPRLILSAMIAIFVTCCGGAWTWNWYSHLPKPKKVSVKIVPIEVTKLEKELKFQRLVIY